MNASVYCLVDPTGRVHTRSRATCHADVAAADALVKGECDEYRFDLTCRRLIADRERHARSQAVWAFLDPRVGTPERLMQFAAGGQLSKSALADLLSPDARPEYLEACARIEREYSTACGRRGDPCLASGCAIDHAAGEVCLEALLRADVEYHKACAARWAEIFDSPLHRIPAWQDSGRTA